MFEPGELTPWPDGLSVHETVTTVKQGSTSQVKIYVTNTTNHDIVVRKHTVLGSLQLIRSITPVEVKLAEKSSKEKERTVTATQSQGVSSRICETILPTVNSISGLIVSWADKSVVVPSPKAYSRENIPARRDQIHRVEMAINWSHLSQIANEIPKYRDDLGIGLLIGNNCVEAIKPRDVIPGKPQDPYAIRTVFGWGFDWSNKPC